MSCRYFEIKDKTHFSCVFGREYKKPSKCQTIILEALLSLHYYKHDIADGFLMVDISLMYHKYSTKKA